MLPEAIRTEEELNEVLSRPRPVLVEFMKTLHNPLVILGAGGKMGPTLALLAQRAAKAAGAPMDIVSVSVILITILQWLIIGRLNQNIRAERMGMSCWMGCTDCGRPRRSGWNASRSGIEKSVRR